MCNTGVNNNTIYSQWDSENIKIHINEQPTNWNKVAYLMEVVFQGLGLVVQVVLCLGRLY